MNEIVLKNPITNAIKDSVNKSINRLNFAVPFLSSYAISILNAPHLKKTIEKRLVTRFDDSSISSFDLKTLKSLIDFGFEIRFDNNIHLKLYITDNEAFVSSSNLTKGGFEDNIELTIKVDTENSQNCMNIFNEIWDNSKGNRVTKELIAANWIKYEVLKKREQFAKIGNKNIVTKQLAVGEIDVQQVINEIFNQKNDYSQTLSLEFEANKLREQTKNKIKQGYNSEIFYVPEGHPMRRTSLFYDFAYGYESRLAGTGLRELQFKTVFEHSDFEKVIHYIFPEMMGLNSWNLQDKSILLEFCNGIFDFEIPQYSEAVPMRLVSYFYPEIFLPIFKLEHMNKICEVLGLDTNTNAKTKGDKLFAFTTFLTDKMKSIPYGNQIKMIISYNSLYTVELFHRLNNKENYESILADYKEAWKRSLIEEGWKVLNKLKVL
jgi:HKD family nuclease